MSQPLPQSVTPEEWNVLGVGHLPELIGLTITAIGRGFAEGRLDVEPRYLAPNGFLNAAILIALADTLCAYGCRMSLPEGATGYTTIELKANFLGAVRDGTIAARAKLVHGGRMTQVWDAEVVAEATGKQITTFRCTQMVLYPR